MDVSAMITLPAGRVPLSDRRTRCRWDVDLAAYSLAAVPVTQARTVSGYRLLRGGGWFDDHWSFRVARSLPAAVSRAVGDPGS